MGVMASACAANGQVVTWVGGFPNDNLSTGTNWLGGTAPTSDGFETLLFNAASNSDLKMDVTADFMGIVVDGTGGNGASASLYGSNTLTIGAGGISLVNGGSWQDSLYIGAPVALSANQVWSTANPGGNITVSGAISGAFALTLQGAPGSTFELDSGASTFSSLSYTGQYTGLVVGSSSTGPAGAPTSGPLGTGVVTMGDGTTLAVNTSNAVMLANPFSLGDNSNGAGIAFGGSSSGGDSPPTTLTLSGPVTLNNNDIELDTGSNTVLTFSGNLMGYAPGVCLDFGTNGMGGYGLVILQGGLSNVARFDLEDNVSVIFDGADVTQVTGLEDIGVGSNNYLGVGANYAAGTNLSQFITYLNTSGSVGSFAGTLGLDTTSGTTPALFNDSNGIDLSNFTNPNFVGLGSATMAVIGPAAVITPPNDFIFNLTGYGDTYRFGGGGGTLTVQSALSDGLEWDGSMFLPFTRSLSLAGGNAPLTLVLSGPLSYSGGTTISGAALIFDTPLPLAGGITLSGGYVGSTENSGYGDDNSFSIQQFVDLIGANSPQGVIGFDQIGSTRSVTSAIDLSGLSSNVYLGTATSVNYSGTITPFGSQYQFAGVKGGQVEVSSNLLAGLYSVLIGLPNPGEAFNLSFGYEPQSSVTLSGTNSYYGGTTLNSGYLFVTNPSSIGTGTLFVPDAPNGRIGWVGTLTAANNPVTLANNIQVSNGGLALNTGSTDTLTLTGVISSWVDDAGQLGIFGPVDLEGNNTFFGGTYVNTPGSIVTVGSDTGLGTGYINANNTTFNFTSDNPVLGTTGREVSFANSTVTFSGTGNTTIYNLSLDTSRITFSGGTTELKGFFGDTGSSNGLIDIDMEGSLLIIDPNKTAGDDSSDATIHGRITGPGALEVTGVGGSLELRGNNTYTGGTTIDAGSVVIASNNNALGSPVGAVVVNGALATNTNVVLNNPITLGSSGVLAGYGKYQPGGTLAFQGGSTVDPGRANLNSSGGGTLIPVPGTLSFGSNTAVTFGAGGNFLFSITDANGAAGAGYGTVSMPASVLTIASGPFTIFVASFDPTTDQLGPMLNFNAASTYQWTLVSALSISGFNPALFNVDTSLLQNGISTGQFFVSQSGGSLLLNFTPVPEPSTWALMATGLSAMVAAVRRRRR